MLAAGRGKEEEVSMRHRKRQTGLEFLQGDPILAVYEDAALKAVFHVMQRSLKRNEHAMVLRAAGLLLSALPEERLGHRWLDRLQAMFRLMPEEYDALIDRLEEIQLLVRK